MRLSLRQQIKQHIYRANFCAECGNLLARANEAATADRRWWPQYFCDECAPRLQRQRWLSNALKPLLVLAGIGTLLIVNYPPDHIPQPAPPTNQPATQLVANALAAPLANPPEPVQVTELCGARTKRGTPCRRLVKAGTRCAHHRGMPSLLTKTVAPTPTPAP